MKKSTLLLILLLSCVAVHMAYSQITVELTSPTNSQKFGDCSDVPLSVNLDIQSGEIKDVRYYANGGQVGFNRKDPYNDDWEGAPNSIYEIWAKATDTDGNEFFSPSVFITVGTNAIEHNICVNGEFTCLTKSGGAAGWGIQTNDVASASYSVEEDLWLSEGRGVLITIEDGGSANWHVQFQQNFNIQAGHSYEVRFMAEAPEAKAIDVAFQEKVDPYTTYSNTGITVSDPDVYGPITFDATVDQPAGQFKFNIGGNTIPIYIDGVEILDEFISGVKETKYVDGKTVETYLLSQNYPNPFNPETTIQYEISHASPVNLTIYDVQGREVVNLVNEMKSAGAYEVKWNGKDANGNRMASGMYIYKITAKMNNKTQQFSRKILLVE